MESLEPPLCPRVVRYKRFVIYYLFYFVGEVLSFYLGRMLGLDNIPVVVLSEADTSKPQWQGQDFRKAGWDQGNTVAFIQWIMNLDHQG